MLKLDRPLCFFDLETTGVSVEKDRIVQVCVCKFFPEDDKTPEVKKHLINPTIPIPAGATKIHGIKDEDVKTKPTFVQFSKSLHQYISGCDMAGFRSNTFDVPMLYYEFIRAGIVWDYLAVNFIDVGNIYVIKEKRTLEAAYLFYCGKELEGAHDAEVDILATAEILPAQLIKYTDIPHTVKELAKFSNYDRDWMDIQGKFAKNEHGDVIFTFGKHKGEPCKNHPGFLEWIVFTSDFAQDVKEYAKKLLGLK